jgi:hypothetical protein
MIIHDFMVAATESRAFQRFFPRALFFIAATLLMLSVWGCRKKAAVPEPPPVASPTETSSKTPEKPTPSAITPPEKPEHIPPEAESNPTSVPKLNNLDLGEINFLAEDYPNAARYFEAWLKENPKSIVRDRVLLYLGFSYALSEGSNRNLGRAAAVLKELVKESAGSQYKSEAEFILGLWARIDNLETDVKEKERKIEQLSEELKKLKEIDMQRRPSLP